MVFSVFGTCAAKKGEKNEIVNDKRAKGKTDQKGGESHTDTVRDLLYLECRLCIRPVRSGCKIIRAAVMVAYQHTGHVYYCRDRSRHSS